MAKICPQCGREFENSRLRCGVCKCDLVSDGIGNSEAARLERLQRIQQAQAKQQQTMAYNQQNRAVASAPTQRKRKKGSGMKVIGILLITLGVIGFFLGLMMFGDIGIACIVGALAALLSGIGFLIADKNI